MKTTVEELKAYYVKIGGNAADVVGIDTIPDMIAKITAISGGGGGSDLPEVTSDDNGDVLTVVEGEWAKAEPQGDEAVVLYTVGAAETDPELQQYPLAETWFNDATFGLSLTPNGVPLTFSELAQLIDSKKRVIIQTTSELEAPTKAYQYPTSALHGEGEYDSGYIVQASFEVRVAGSTQQYGAIFYGNGK